jgi:hypothetical protein
MAIIADVITTLLIDAMHGLPVAARHTSVREVVL